MITKHTTFKRRYEIINLDKSQLRFIFNCAKKDHAPQSWILDQITSQIYNSKYNKYEYLTGNERSLLRGYTDCLFDEMWNHLEWVHWYNGKFVGKDLPYGEGFDQLLINKSAHVYKGTQDCY